MADELTIFYAADVHGADLCFKKWLNAGPFYGADVVVIGGDLTGKVLVPICPADGSARGWRARWSGTTVELATRQEVARFSSSIREVGAYGYETTPDELDQIHASPELERKVFRRLKLAALEEWLAWAEERLSGKAIQALLMPGNDDPPEIDALLDSSSSIRNVQGEAVELAPGIWIASRGESTPTPWRTPRELPEVELAACVRQAVEPIPAGATAIWNIHMPPHDTGIDSAPQLDAELRVRYDGSGEPLMAPVGSRLLRELIEERQPAVGLHGHIHEGRGRYKLGRTVGFNPGSRYEDGVLMGVLLRIARGKGVRDYAFTTG